MSAEDISKLEGVISFKFQYDGALREVDNVSIAKKLDCIIGFEIRKAGKWSHKIKTYKIDKITQLVQIEPIERNRP